MNRDLSVTITLDAPTAYAPTGRVVVLRPAGRLDSVNCQAFEAQLADIGRADLVIDLSGATLLSPAAVAMLTRFADRCRAEGRSLFLAAAPDPAAALLRRTRHDNAATPAPYDDVLAALDGLRNRPAATASSDAAPNGRRLGAYADGPDFEAVFRASPSPLLILDPGLVIQDVNTAYASVTRRDPAELIGRHVFEAFPDNPDDPGADGVQNLSASLQRVIEHGAVDTMKVQRYDIAWGPERRFVEKYWSPVNSPLLSPEDEVTGLVHHVEEVTDFQRGLARAVRAYERTDTPTTGTHQADAQRQFAHYIAQAQQARERYGDLQEEVSQLKQALHSRSAIDQAIGIIMGERSCSPDDAFQILVRVSQHSNAKLRDIAHALLQRATDGADAVGGGTPPGGKRG